LRADQPERGGRELLRRAERAKLTGRIDEAEAIRERVSTLAPSLLTSFPGTPGAAVPVPTGAPGAPAQPARPEAGLEPGVEEAVDRGLGFEPSSRAIER